MTSAARRPHIIRPNRSSAAPQAWVALAINTTPVQIGERRYRHEFKDGAAIYWRMARATKGEVLEYYMFSDPRSFVARAIGSINEKERLGVIAHDMDFVAQVMDVRCLIRERQWRPTKLVLERGRWVQRWKQGISRECDGSRAMLWLDLQNFFPTTIRNVARWLGLPMPESGTDDEDWLHTSNGAKWRATITLRAAQSWLDFLSRFDLGYFSATLAGQAFNAYRHRFMEHPIYVHIHDDVIAMEREANYGGRIEARFRGRAPKDHYAQVDVTSFYASVMHGNRFPTKQVGHGRGVGLRQLRELAENYCVVARVELATEEPAFPKREGESVYFPVGRFVTTLCTPEIQLALRRGAIARCEEIVTYEHAPIFDRYVECFWDLRQRAMRVGDTLTIELAKRFLTTVFGKFGQRIWLASLIRDDAVGPDAIWREYDWQDRMEYEYRVVAGRMERSVRDVQGRDTLVAIPAHVTSYGRVALWRLMEKAGCEHIYYVDTDSMIGRSVILQRLGDEFANKQLGGLRLVRSSSHLFIRAPKWYILGDTRRRAGVPDDALEVQWNVFEGTETRSTRYQLLHGDPHSAIVEAVRIVGPLTDRLSTRELGHLVEPLRYGPTPTPLARGLAQIHLPLPPERASETVRGR